MRADGKTGMRWIELARPSATRLSGDKRASWAACGRTGKQRCGGRENLDLGDLTRLAGRLKFVWRQTCEPAGAAQIAVKLPEKREILPRQPYYIPVAAMALSFFVIGKQSKSSDNMKVFNQGVTRRKK